MGLMTVQPVNPTVLDESELQIYGKFENIKHRMFVFSDGIDFSSTAASLHKRGVFDIFKQKDEVSLKEITETLGKSTDTPNSGYLRIAMHLVADVGWVERHASDYDPNNSFKITKRGKAALEYMDAYFHSDTAYQVATKVNELLSPHQNPDPSILEKFSTSINHLKNDWGLPQTSDPLKKDVRSQIVDHISGILVGPTWLALAENGALAKLEEANEGLTPQQLGVNEKGMELAFNLLQHERLLEKNGDKIRLTRQGKILARPARAYSFGVPTSYLPTIVNVDKLIFSIDHRKIFNRDADGHEIHVDRGLNVRSSNAAHEWYFQAVAKGLSKIFNNPNLEQQPSLIVDTGCGGGGLIKSTYDYIRENTLRGKHLDTHPLMMVGVDFNQAALTEAQKHLGADGVPFKLIHGDINKPDEIAKKLEEQGLQPLDALHMNSFLVHNRPFRMPFDLVKGSERKITTSGSYVHNGEYVPNELLEQNLVEFFKQWRPWTKKHGWLIIEMHNLPPKKAAAMTGNMPATSYDATHFYSSQYPLEYTVFEKLAEEGGMKPDPLASTLFPPEKENARISVNLFQSK